MISLDADRLQFHKNCSYKHSCNAPILSSFIIKTIIEETRYRTGTMKKRTSETSAFNYLYRNYVKKEPSELLYFESLGKIWLDILLITASMSQLRFVIKRNKAGLAALTKISRY